jgi:hypothetical protein
MKKIYILFVLLNVLALSNVKAQFPYCNLQYTVDTIAYNPAPFNAGTNVPFQGPDTFMSGLVPIGFTFNYYGIDYTNIVVNPTGYITFNTSMANYHPCPSVNTSMNIFPAPFQPENSIFIFAAYDGITVNIDTTKILYTSINR